jgi:hypothetical protein
VADWRDNWHATYKAWALTPVPVFQAQVFDVGYRSGSNVSVVSYIQVMSITLGAVTDAKRDMTILIGSSAGASDKGRARIQKDGASTLLYVACPINKHDGELNPEYGDYITVWDDYRAWLKPPYAPSGYYLFDEEYGSAGTTKTQWPMANGGPGYAYDVDPSTGLITVQFPPDGINYSFPVADDAVFGGYTANLFLTKGTVTASSGTAANAVDNNTATYWAPASASANEYLQGDLGEPERIRMCDITAHGSYYPPDQIIIQYSDDNVNYITALFDERISGWGSPSYIRFYIHDVGAHRYWRLYPQDSDIVHPLRIYEWQLYAEDRTAGTPPFAWDVGADGSIVVGSTSSETITATFPVGFRHVHLTATDTNGEEHTMHIPVLASGYLVGSELSYTGVTYATNGSGSPANLLDGDTGTIWYIPVASALPRYVEFTFPQHEIVSQYKLQISNNYNWTPRDFDLYADDVIVDSQTGITWTSALQEKTFTLTTPVEATTWKLVITASNSASSYYAVLSEMAFIGVDATYMPIDCAIVNHELTPGGQTIDLDIFQDLPETTYPDGTLVMVWQDEYYDNVHGGISDWSDTGEFDYTGGAVTESIDDATRLFDNSTGTPWACYNVPNWAQIAFTPYKKLGSYGIQAQSNTDNATAWSVYVDGVLVDSQSGETGWAPFEERIYTLSTPVVGRVFKLLITATNGSSPNYLSAILEWNLYHSDEPSGREHTVFNGWISEEPTRIDSLDQIVLPSTTLRCVDIGGRLQQLSSFTMFAEKDSSPAGNWAYQMKHACLDAFLYVMVEWMTTAGSLADFRWSNTGDDANFGVLSAQGSNIFEMIDNRAQAIFHQFTCNKRGQLKLLPDPLLSDDRFRANETVKEVLTAADYYSLSYTRNRTPRVQWLYSGGVTFNSEDADSLYFTAGPVTFVAPGSAPGQGVGTGDLGEKLLSWSHYVINSSAIGSDLGISMGKYYAQLQAFISTIELELAHPGDNGLDPAEMQIVQLNVPSDIAAQRGLTFTDADGIIRRITYRYKPDILSREVFIEWEQRHDYVEAHAALAVG